MFVSIYEVNDSISSNLLPYTASGVCSFFIMYFRGRRSKRKKKKKKPTTIYQRQTTSKINRCVAFCLNISPFAE